MTKLKNYSLLSLLSLTCLSAGAVNSWNLHYDVPASTEGAKQIAIGWATAIGSTVSDGYWYKGDSYTSENAMKGWAISYEDDDFSLGDKTGRPGPSGTVYDTIFLDLNDNTTMGSLTLNGNAWNNSARVRGSYDLTIKRDLIRAEGAYMGFIDVKSLIVNGNIFNYSNNLAIVASNGVRVAGDIYSSGSANLYLTSSGTAENPGMIVNGLIRGKIAINSKPTGKNNYIQVSGVTEGAALSREAPASSGADNFVSYYTLVNTTDCVTTGSSTEKNGNVWMNNSGKVSFIMNGTGSQSFNSNFMFFHGGVKVENGTFKINFNQNLYQAYFRDSTGKIKVQAVSDNTGRYATAFSRGDLVMQGGEFGSSATGPEDASSYGVFRFTNIVYTAGTIILRLDSETTTDTLDLTTYYDMVQNSTSGSTVTSFEEVAGGTLTKTEGAGKVTFNFGENLGWLINAENDGLKIISWDVTKKAALTADDFAANTFTNSEGDEFTALFAVNDDGLYVKYVAVPEPATVAAIFGALALAFAAYRRRK